MEKPKKPHKKNGSVEEIHFTKTVVTPLGFLTLVATEFAITALVFEKGDLIKLGHLHLQENPTHPLLKKAEKQLLEYFSGSRKSFELPLNLQGTAFQKSVWQALKKIPFGKTCSYREIANKIGNTGAMRAVGNANGKNPISILIPCHRVVQSNGELGGYSGGAALKAFLLNLESGSKKFSP